MVPGVCVCFNVYVTLVRLSFFFFVYLLFLSGWNLVAVLPCSFESGHAKEGTVPVQYDGSGELQNSFESEVRSFGCVVYDVLRALFDWRTGHSTALL